MKKIVCMLCMLCLLLPVGVSAATVTQEDYVTYEQVGDAYVVTDCVESVKGELVIPATYEGKPVTAIGDRAFFGCHTLSAVVIPEGVTAIGEQAFYGCTNLSNVTIPDSVTSIGFDAFDETSYYNNEKNWDNFLLYIGDCLVAADRANLVGSAVINEGTRLIADYAFYGTKITAVSVPASVKAVGKNAFAECAKLEDVYYGGTEEEWQTVAAADGNAALEAAEKHYGELLEKPTSEDTDDKGTGTPSTDKKRDLWLWISVVSAVVAVVTFVLMFLPKKERESADEKEKKADETE